MSTTITQRFGPGQHVVILDNTDPDDPYTGAMGRICASTSGARGWVYSVLFDDLVNHRHMGEFREDELEAATIVDEIQAFNRRPQGMPNLFRKLGEIAAQEATDAPLG